MISGPGKKTIQVTRSTQRAQTSLAEADDYSHIVHCKNVELWLWKTTHPPKKVLDHYLHHDLGMLPLLWCFFAHLLILQYPDHHQNLISSYLYYSGPVHPNPFITFWVMLFTDKQTNRQTNATKNITSFAKEVICQGGNYLNNWCGGNNWFGRIGCPGNYLSQFVWDQDVILDSVVPLTTQLCTVGLHQAYSA